MSSSEARLYFVMTVKGDLGPYSKQELRVQLRERSFAATDRVRNAFGRPLGSVSEVLGNVSQTIQAPPSPTPASSRRPAKSATPWPIIAVAAGIIVVLLLLWLTSGRNSPPPAPVQPTEIPQTVAPAQPAQTQPGPTVASAPPPVSVRSQPAPIPVSSGLPAGFSLIDLGDARPTGKADANDRGMIVINGGGGDIWGSRDECAYLHRQLAGDGMMTVEIQSKEDTDGWDKSGLMIRGSTAPDAMHVSIVVIHDGLVQFLYRSNDGHETTSTDLRLPSFPIWLRLERRGTAYAGSASVDGKAWQQIGTAELAGSGPAVAGLAVCSHNRSVTNRTVFAGLTVNESR
jgi:regulation of enolase protein 1 (concanavalin A-like superfamily)